MCIHNSIFFSILHSVSHSVTHSVTHSITSPASHPFTYICTKINSHPSITNPFHPRLSQPPNTPPRLPLHSLTFLTRLSYLTLWPALVTITNSLALLTHTHTHTRARARTHTHTLWIKILIWYFPTVIVYSWLSSRIPLHLDQDLVLYETRAASDRVIKVIICW